MLLAHIHYYGNPIEYVKSDSHVKVSKSLDEILIFLRTHHDAKNEFDEVIEPLIHKTLQHEKEFVYHEPSLFISFRITSLSESNL
jgi:hypothetical protein